MSIVGTYIPGTSVESTVAAVFVWHIASSRAARLFQLGQQPVALPAGEPPWHEGGTNDQQPEPQGAVHQQQSEHEDQDSQLTLTAAINQRNDCERLGQPTDPTILDSTNSKQDDAGDEPLTAAAPGYASLDTALFHSFCEGPEHFCSSCREALYKGSGRGCRE
ncbi:MAG: hypothetical protein FRX49_09040 [Trebouxia sp. A1-2]|nr:MAG: hypothetical protein FRX49_09040 [Trebouxia sp. A1-2]